MQNAVCFPVHGSPCYVATFFSCLLFCSYGIAKGSAEALRNMIAPQVCLFATHTLA